MKLRLLPVLLAFAAATAAWGQATIPFTGGGIIDSSGAAVTGTLTVTATDASNNPIAGIPVVINQVLNGVLLPGSNLPNPATTTPVNPMYRFTITNAKGTVVATLPLVVVPQVAQYSIENYATPAGITIQTAGYPRIACQAGALATDTVNGGNGWICSKLATDGTIVWTQNPSSSPQCAGNQALASPAYGAPYCVASTEAYAAAGEVYGAPASGAGPAGLQTGVGGGGTTGGVSLAQFNSAIAPVQQTATAAQTAATQAQTTATAAQNTATSAASSASAAQSAAQSAQTAATNAQTAAGTANTNASAALTAAQNAVPAAPASSWSSTVMYGKGALVIYTATTGSGSSQTSTTSTWVSTVANNLNNTPGATGSTAWGIFAQGSAAGSAVATYPQSTAAQQTLVAQQAGSTTYTPTSLANVALSGSYGDLSNKPTLGTAAAANTTAFDAAGTAASAVAPVQTTANNALALAQGAVPAASATTYAAGSTYAKAAEVKDAAGNRYVSLQANNTGNTPNPAADTAYWALLSPAPTTSLPYTAITNPPTIPTTVASLTRAATDYSGVYATTSQVGVQFQTVTPTPNGTATTFTVANSVPASAVAIYYDGELLSSAAGDYTTSGSTFTLPFAPATGDVLSAAVNGVVSNTSSSGNGSANSGSGSGSSSTSTNIPSVLAYGADPTGAADSTAAIKAALAANPQGSIFFPTQSGGQASMYKISAPVTLNLRQWLVGAGAGAVTLQCTATSGACIVGSDPNQATFWASGLRDISVNGPGSGNANAIGVYLGGDPAGAISPSGNYGDSFLFIRATISNFGVGVQWGNNAWSNRFEFCAIGGNATGLSAPAGLNNSGEGIHIVGSTIFNGGIPISGQTGFDWFIDGSEIDYNSQPMNFINGGLHVTNTHWEQTAGDFILVPYGTVQITIAGGIMLLTGTTGTDKDFLDLYPQAGTVVLDGLDLYSSHAVTEAIFASGSNAIIGRLANLNDGTNIASVLQAGATQAGLTSYGFNNSYLLPYTIPASAAPVLDLTKSAFQTITLSANAAPTLANLVGGQHGTFQICQPASGGPYTWTWPSAVKNGITIGTAAGMCSIQQFTSISGSTLLGYPGVINVAP